MAAGRSVGVAVERVVAPVLLGVVGLVVWQLAVGEVDVRTPSPIGIWEAFTGRFGLIAGASLSTAGNALLGLVIGTVLAVVWALLCSAGRWLEQLSAPVVMALSVVPLVSLAPVFYAMFNSSLQTGRVVVAGIAAFVPVYYNTLRGLQTVLPIHRDLMRAYAASGWQTARTVTLPGALPFFFTGVRIASSITVISALVAEYFGGPVSGIGNAITNAVSGSNYALAWAYVLGAVVVGLVFYVVTTLFEVLATRHRSA